MTEGVNVVALMQELSDRAQSIDKASSKLMRLTKEFEGTYMVRTADPETGEVIAESDWKPGPQLLFEIAVTEATEAIAEEYEKDDKKVPAQERLRKKGELRVRAEKPDLWNDYYRLSGEIDALQKWISARTKTLSARQSVLSAEKALVNG